MKKIFFAFILIFASSLVLFISCDKESVTPLIPEENQGILYKEQGVSEVEVCCESKQTLFYSEDDEKACCDGGYGCLPCNIVNYSQVYQSLQILASMLKDQIPTTQNFFSDYENFKILFPSLLTTEYQSQLNDLKSGDYLLIKIIIDDKTNNRVYVFEHKTTGARICLVVNII